MADTWVYRMTGGPLYDTGSGMTTALVQFFAGEVDGLQPGGLKAMVGLHRQFTASVRIDHLLFGGASLQTPTYGEITIALGDGYRDAYFVPPYYWTGCGVTLDRVRKSQWNIAAFESVFSGLVEDLRYDRAAVSLIVRDRSLALEQRVQRRVYAGTGNGATAEGDESLKDVPKPITLGTCFNVAPVPVDRANAVYQFHDGQFSAAKAVLGAYDGAEKLNPTTAGSSDGGEGSNNNFASFAALLAWSPPGPGTYATCLSAGLVRAAAAPVFPLTIDVRGDAGDPDVSGGWSDYWHLLCRRLVKGYAGIADGLIDSAGISALSETRGAGFYTGTDPVLISQVVADLAGAGCGFALFGRDSIFRVGLMNASAMPVATLGEDVIVDVRRERTPVPSSQIRIGYARAWSVQGELEMAGAAAASRKTFQANAHRYVQTPTSIEPKYPTATPRTYDSLLATSAGAVQSAIQTLLVQQGGWRRLTVQVYGQQLARSVGEVVTLDHPRFGLSSVAALIVGVTEDVSIDGFVTLELLAPGGG